MALVHRFRAAQVEAVLDALDALRRVALTRADAASVGTHTMLAEAMTRAVRGARR